MGNWELGGVISIYHGGISGCEDGEFYGFCSDFERRKAKVREELQKAIGCDLYTISTYGEDTEEWEESNAKLGGKKNELSRHIELSWGFGGLREKLGNSEEDKIWKVDGETRKQEIVGNQLPTIQEGEVEMISGR